jgi:hypothetical protein
MMRKICSTVVFVLLLGLCQHAAGQNWQLSPSAEHHAAVVEVKTFIRNTHNGREYGKGSGTYVRYGELTGIMTAAHVVKGGPLGTSEVIWQDGTKVSGAWTNCRLGADVAWVDAQHATIPPLEIGESPPQQGEWLELCGYGGPGDSSKNSFRHWWGTFAASGRMTDNRGNPEAEYHCPVMEGDSGGAILNQQRQLVGVIATGDVPIRRIGTALALDGMGGPAHSVVLAFAGRVQQRGCGPSSCPPPQGGGGGAYPPRIAPTPRQKPDQPPPLVPVPPVAPTIDLDSLAEKLVEKMAEDPRFKGPPGQDGQDGKDGQDGQPGKDGAPGQDGLPGPGPTDEQILAAVEAWFASNPPPTVQPPVAGWSHLVLVYPKTASYARRLEDNLKRAREHWSHIRTAEPPEYAVGEIPALVAYSTGKADRVWRGLRQVEEALTAMTRGEFDSFLLREGATRWH